MGFFDLKIISLYAEDRKVSLLIVNKPGNNKSSPSKLPYIILTILFVLSFLLSYYIHQLITARNEARFHYLAIQAKEKVESSFDSYIALLYAVRGLFSASDEVTKKEFKKFIHEIQLKKRFPGVQGIGFSARVRPDEKNQLIQSMQKQGVPDFKIWPDYKREEYHTIIYLEPLDMRNQATLGYDMSTNAEQKRAMQDAAITGQATATSQVTLPQEIIGKIQPGFIIYLPIYKNDAVVETVQERQDHLIGYVYAVFRSQDLFTGIFRPQHVDKLSLEIYDGETTERSHLLFTSPLSPLIQDYKPRFSDEMHIKKANHTWTIQFHSHPQYELLIRKMWENIIFVISLLTSFSIFFILLSQTRTQTQLKEKTEALEASEQYYRLQSEAIPQIVWTATPDGSIEYFNQKWFAYTRLTSTQSHGWLWMENVHPEDQEKFTRAWEKSLQTGEILATEIRLQNTNHLYRWHLCRALPLIDKSGNIKKWFGTFTDIDDQKRLQENMITANRELIRINQMKSDFTSMVSHELRTPLAAIKEGIDLIIDEIEGPINESQKETLGISKANVDRLSRLITNVLDFSRIEKGKLQLNKTDHNLNNIIKESYQTMNFSAQKKRLDFQLHLLDQPVSAHVDADKIKQVLVNLLDNAIKFTPPNGRITLQLTPQQDHAEINVTDSGPGIKKEDQELIFEMYSQSKSPFITQGAGVGLAVCKQIVEMHGGNIFLQSEEGKGSTFTFTLPYEAGE